MFNYFPDNYWWSLNVMSAIGMGGEISEIDEICKPLQHAAGRENDDYARDQWCESWSRMAARLERVAQGDEAIGHRTGASRKYLRAASYQLIGEGMLRPGQRGKVQAYEQALELFAKGTALSRHPVEHVEVPFEDTTLPAVFVPGQGVDGPAPCMVHFDGSDDLKEINCMRHRQGMAEQGISMLIVDHPGSGGALRLRGLAARPDIEVAASASVDYLLGRDDVDQARIGIMAQSLGGYYAPRAAAFEQRFVVCVVWGAIWDWYLVRKGQGSTFAAEDFALLGDHDPATIVDTVRRFTLDDGVAERVRCPILILHGANDRQCPMWTAQKTYDRVVNSAHRELKVFTLDEGGASHCQADVMTMATDYIHDWLGRFFAESRSEVRVDGAVA
jgi:dienelactone hydrolase